MNANLPSPHLPLEGRIAFVAGAGSRFGRAAAIALAEAGAAIALCSATSETAEEFAINSAANELWALGRNHVTLSADFTEPPSISEVVRRALAELGPIDLLVTAPDPLPGTPLAFDATTDADWRRVLQLHLDGVALACRAVAEEMLKRGSGGILCVVSDASHGRAGLAALAAGQAGVIGLTRSLALEWSGRIGVNAAVVREETAPPSLGALATLLAERDARGSAASITGQVFKL